MAADKPAQPGASVGLGLLRDKTRPSRSPSLGSEAPSGWRPDALGLRPMVDVCSNQEMRAGVLHRSERSLSAFALLSGEKCFDEERSHASRKIDGKAGVTRRWSHGLSAPTVEVA